MNTPLTATHVFYSPNGNYIIDTCTDETNPRSHVRGETIEEIRLRYPDAVYMEWDNASKLMDENNRLPVSEITIERFWYALEVLPPEGWKQESGCESFKMMERWSGNITDIYVRIGERYFELRDSFLLPHAEIIRRCQEFIKNN